MSDPLGDFPIGWLVLWTEERGAIEAFKKLKNRVAQRLFPTRELADRFKLEMQAAGYIASMKPAYRTTKDRERAFKQRQQRLDDDWPLQTRLPK